MALFEKAKLFVSVDEDEDYVEFSVNTEIKFEEHEKIIKWMLTMNFFEHDTFSSDDFITKIQRIIDPNDLEEVFEVKIKKDKVDKDWFKEEVYVSLELKPMQTFTPASLMSDTVKFSAD